MPVTAKENMEPPPRKVPVDVHDIQDSTGGGGGLEFVTTRFPTAATAPRVSVNPLQFVKVAPPKLFTSPGGVPSAADREKEEKERRKKLRHEAAEDWQENLDNWKSSRLKRVEHIVERVEEVRRVEQEDSVWSVTGRRKSKTFNEMMEERNTRGVRKTSLGLIGLSYPADDDEDVLAFAPPGGEGSSSGGASSKEQQDWGTGSDRGTSATSSLSGLDSGGQLSEAETDRDVPGIKENGTKAEDNNNNDRSNNGNDGDNGNHGEGPEEEIYTYERAIQEYVNYTERRNSGGVAVMERKNGEVTATLPDVRNGVSEEPSSPKKQSHGPSTFESVKSSVQSWTVDEEAEDGSGETEEEAEEEVLRRISFKEKLASFRNLESSKIKTLPTQNITDAHMSETKEKLAKVKTENQEDKLVVYHANEDSGINTGDASQSDGEEEISTPMCRNSKPELANAMKTASADTIVNEQQYDGVTKSDIEKKQGGGTSTGILGKELKNERFESSKSEEESPPVAHSTPLSSPAPSTPIPSTTAAPVIGPSTSKPSTPIKSPGKPKPTVMNGQSESVPASPPVKSPRTPPVPPPRPSHKQVTAEIISTNPSALKTSEVMSQEPVTPQTPPSSQENTVRGTIETCMEINQNKEQITEPQVNIVSSLPIKSCPTDVIVCKTVTQLASPTSPIKNKNPSTTEVSSVDSGLCKDKVDSMSPEVVLGGENESTAPVNSVASAAAQENNFTDGTPVKEVSQDLSTAVLPTEIKAPQPSVIAPKIVPPLLGESKMGPPTMGELRGLEALDALLAVIPPPSTPLPPVLDLTSEGVHVVGGLAFALSTPPKTLAPPTEKPPPPPGSSPPSTLTGSLSRKSTGSNAGPGVGDFRRRNSTKRIRKEIRRKRSDFLGIDASHEGSDGDGEDVADEMEPPELLTISRDVPTSSECTAEEEDEEDGEYGEEDVEQELVRLQEQEPSPHCGGLDVSSSPLPGETEEEEEEERSSCQTQETDSGVELTEKDREVRRGKKIAEIEDIEDRRTVRMQGIQTLYSKEVEAKNNTSNQYYGPVVAEPVATMHHQSMQDVRMRESIIEEPVICSREEPIQNCPPPTLRRSLPDFAHTEGVDVVQSQQMVHSDQPPWRRSQPPPVPPHKPRPMPAPEVAPPPPKTNVRQAHLRALNVPPKPRIIPTDGWVSPEVRSSHAYEWNGSPQHPLSPNNVPQHTNHPFANSLPRNHMPIQSGSPLVSPERRASQPSGYPMGSLVKNGGVHQGSIDGVQREERDNVPRRKKTEGGGYNYQHWLIQEAEHRRITEMQDRRRSQNGVSTRENSVEEAITNGSPSRGKPLPDSIIQTLTQRVQGRTAAMSSPNHRPEPQLIRSEGRPKSADMSVAHHQLPNVQRHPQQQRPSLPGQPQSEKMLSVSGKKKCSHCSQELGRGAAMIIESLRLFYHIGCFRCCVCHAQLGDGLVGADVRVRAGRLHCHHCYSSDDGVKFSCV